MENVRQIGLWLLDNHKALGLQAVQMDWIGEWLPRFYDFEVSISVNGKTHTGRGVDQNSYRAFVKASSEAIERAFCFENKISSSGVATHSELALAKRNARDELVERDRFFCHYLTRIPFQEINFDIPEIDFFTIREKLKKRGVNLQVFEMNRLNHIRAIICISSGASAGMTLGLGASLNKFVAAKKAIVECLVNTVAALDGKVIPLSFGQFQSSPSIWPAFHRRLYLKESELAKSNSWMLKGKDDCPSTYMNPYLFKYSKLEAKAGILKECPLITIRCQNASLQKAFFGKFDSKNINWGQMRRFAQGLVKDASCLNQWPHPLG